MICRRFCSPSPAGATATGRRVTRALHRSSRRSHHCRRGPACLVRSVPPRPRPRAPVTRRLVRTRPSATGPEPAPSRARAAAVDNRYAAQAPGAIYQSRYAGPHQPDDQGHHSTDQLRWIPEPINQRTSAVHQPARDRHRRFIHRAIDDGLDAGGRYATQVAGVAAAPPNTPQAVVYGVEVAACSTAAQLRGSIGR